MIRAAYDQGVTPWIRTRNDPWVLMTVLDMGAKAISISNMSSVEEAKRAVAGLLPADRRARGRPPEPFRYVPASEYLRLVRQRGVPLGPDRGQRGDRELQGDRQGRSDWLHPDRSQRHLVGARRPRARST